MFTFLPSLLWYSTVTLECVEKVISYPYSIYLWLTVDQDIISLYWITRPNTQWWMENGPAVTSNNFTLSLLLPSLLKWKTETQWWLHHFRFFPVVLPLQHALLCSTFSWRQSVCIFWEESLATSEPFNVHPACKPIRKYIVCFEQTFCACSIWLTRIIKHLNKNHCLLALERSQPCHRQLGRLAKGKMHLCWGTPGQHGETAMPSAPPLLLRSQTKHLYLIRASFGESQEMRHILSSQLHKLKETSQKGQLPDTPCIASVSQG